MFAPHWLTNSMKHLCFSHCLPCGEVGLAPSFPFTIAHQSLVLSLLHPNFSQSPVLSLPQLWHGPQLPSVASSPRLLPHLPASSITPYSSSHTAQEGSFYTQS